MLWSIELFSHYVKGEEFTVVTDCRALLYLKGNSTNARIARWIMRLQEFDFQVKHRAGKLAVIADTMSRQPNESTNPYQEPEIEKLYKDTKPFASIFEGIVQESDETCLLYLTNKAQEKYTPATVEKTLTEIFDKSKPFGNLFVDNKNEEIVKVLTRSNQKPPKDKEDVSIAVEKKRGRPKKRGTDFKEIEPENQNTNDNNTSTKNKSNQQDFGTLLEDEKEKIGGFFGDFPDIMTDKINEWIIEQSTSESVRDLKELSDKGHTIQTNQDGLKVKITTEKRRKTNREQDEEKKTELVYVPITLRRYILLAHHNLQIHGHQGINRLIKQIKCRYYWAGMRVDATRHVNACLTCQKRKSTRSMQSGLTQQIQAKCPWDTVGIDLVGKCVTSEKGNCWILTCVDHFTRYPIVIAIPDRKSETIAKALYDNLFCVHGAPKQILSDRGKELISESLQYIYDTWGVRLVTTGGYNPQANGACERFHRWLHAAMTCVYDKKTLNWDSYLEPLAFAYRVSVNDATGYSPFYLMHGREATLPLDAMLNLNTNSAGNEPYEETLSKNLRQAFEVARQQQHAAYLENYERIQNRQKPDFKKGDMVLMYKKNEKESRLEIAGVKKALPNKWRIWWVGPGLFEKEISNTEAEINMNGKLIFVNYNRLKKFKPWDSIKINSDEKYNSDKNDIFDIEEEDEQKQPPSAGDMIIFLMDSDDYQNADFGVGKILEVNDDPNDLFKVHWYGNADYDRNGRFLPGYVDKKDKRWFYGAENKARKFLYDSSYTSSKFTKEMVVTYGNLLKDGFLKPSILEKMDKFKIEYMREQRERN
jgi:transposase InsO family protein